MGRTSGHTSGGYKMSRISALRAFAVAAIPGAAPPATPTASANPYILGYAPQDQRSVETMTEPNEGFQQVARFKRQIVSYYTHEAPGTIIIDTPNTYLYLVLGNGRAMRSGTGVGREGFTWAG